MHECSDFRNDKSCMFCSHQFQTWSLDCVLASLYYWIQQVQDTILNQLYPVWIMGYTIQIPDYTNLIRGLHWPLLATIYQWLHCVLHKWHTQRQSDCKCAWGADSKCAGVTVGIWPISPSCILQIKSLKGWLSLIFHQHRRDWYQIKEDISNHELSKPTVNQGCTNTCWICKLQLRGHQEMSKEYICADRVTELWRCCIYN